MIVIFIVAIFLLLIIPHELGHFLTAKLSGMKVEKFSIGFGPRLFGVKRGETEYAVSAFPIGGYVKIAGMEPGERQTEDGFYSKPLGNRFGVLFSGSAMNFLASVLLFSFIFMVGFQTMDMEAPVVGEIIDNSPAQEVGLKPGDRILKIDDHPIEKWQEIASVIQDSEGKLTLLIKRGEETFTVRLEPKYFPEYERELIGISPSTQFVRYDPFTSIRMGAERVGFAIVLIFRTLGGMITGEIPAKSAVAGPVGIVRYVGEAQQMGMIPYLSLAALLGVNLGLFNLFPIPALDGGRILFLIIEAIRRKPVEVEVQEFVHYVGFLILIALMFLVTYQDILRLAG